MKSDQMLILCICRIRRTLCEDYLLVIGVIEAAVLHACETGDAGCLSAPPPAL